MRVLVHCISAVWILNVQFVIQATPCTNKRITLNSGWVYALHMILELAILNHWLGISSISDSALCATWFGPVCHPIVAVQR